MQVVGSEAPRSAHPTPERQQQGSTRDVRSAAGDAFPIDDAAGPPRGVRRSSTELRTRCLWHCVSGTSTDIMGERPVVTRRVGEVSERSSEDTFHRA
jgi:hypothetical protein